MRTIPLLAVVAATLSACGESDSMPSTVTSPTSAASAALKASDAATHRYRITIENLTTGQPFSPGVIVTHTNRTSLFAMGEIASAGVRAIAESGNPAIAAAELDGAHGVFDVVTTGAPVGRVGDASIPSSLTAEVSASANANRLSLSLMLICTNDGFVGIDGIKLPGGFEPVMTYAYGYDAGSEVNDEAETSIVGGCFAIGPVGGFSGGPGHIAEGGVVAMHEGIQFNGVLSAAHDWSGPVARVTIQRIK